MSKKKIIIAAGVFVISFSSLFFISNILASSAIMKNNSSISVPVTKQSDSDAPYKSLEVRGKISINDYEAAKKYTGEVRSDEEIASEAYHYPGNPTHVCIVLANHPDVCHKIKVDSPDGTYALEIDLTKSDVEYLRTHRKDKLIYVYAINPLNITQAARTSFNGYSMENMRFGRILILSDKRLYIELPGVTLKGTKKLGIALDRWGAPYHTDTSSDGDFRAFNKLTGKDCRKLPGIVISTKQSAMMLFENHAYQSL